MSIVKFREKAKENLRKNGKFLLSHHPAFGHLLPKGSPHPKSFSQREKDLPSLSLWERDRG